MVRTRYLNSEGSAFTRASPWLVLRIHAATQAVDGMPLGDGISDVGQFVSSKARFIKRDSVGER